jgi:hypothetical protein
MAEMLIGVLANRYRRRSEVEIPLARLTRLVVSPKQALMGAGYYWKSP